MQAVEEHDHRQLSLTFAHSHCAAPSSPAPTAPHLFCQPTAAFTRFYTMGWVSATRLTAIARNDATCAFHVRWARGRHTCAHAPTSPRSSHANIAKVTHAASCSESGHWPCRVRHSTAPSRINRRSFQVRSAPSAELRSGVHNSRSRFLAGSETHSVCVTDLPTVVVCELVRSLSLTRIIHRWHVQFKRAIGRDSTPNGVWWTIRHLSPRIENATRLHETVVASRPVTAHIRW